MIEPNFEICEASEMDETIQRNNSWIKLSKNLSEDFDDEIESIFLEKQVIYDDTIVYAGHTIGNVAFASQEEEIKFVQDKCIVVEDDNNLYIVAREKYVTKFAGEDFIVQKCPKNKYNHLLRDE